MINIKLPTDFEIRCAWFDYVPFSEFTAMLLGYLLVKKWVKVHVIKPEEMMKKMYDKDPWSERYDRKHKIYPYGLYERETNEIYISSICKYRHNYWMTYLHELAHTRKLARAEWDKIEKHGSDWAQIYTMLSAKSAGIFWFLGKGGISASFKG
jgi:hypothetical protein